MSNNQLLSVLVLLLFLNACATATKKQLIKSSPSIWQFTNPAQAFEFAKREHKPILLYWGAVWCPPCNELKSNLFTKQEFAELVRQVVTVYLDGDNEIAQREGERLKVSSYPTLLLLDQSGREVVRIVEPLSIDEFSSLFRSALLRLKPESERIAAVLSGNASEDDFRILSLADLSDISAYDETMFRKLAEKTPPRLHRERSMLLIKAITYAMEKDQKEIDKTWATDALVDILKDAAHPLPAFFSFRAKDTKEWLSEPVFAKRIEKKWIERTTKERNDATRSLTSRLWSYLPELELKSDKMTSEKKLQLQNEILELFSRAQNNYDRHATTSAVAALLPLLGADEVARELLKKALQNPDEKTPWYFEASLAELEAEKGNVKDALLWSERSRKSAKGLATSIQWEAMNIMLNVKLQKDAHQHIVSLLSDFYEKLFQVKDGFSGRNRLYATRVAKALQPELSHYRSVITRFVAKCGTLSGEEAGLCKDYFVQSFSP